MQSPESDDPVTCITPEKLMLETLLDECPTGRVCCKPRGSYEGEISVNPRRELYAVTKFIQIVG